MITVVCVTYKQEVYEVRRTYPDIENQHDKPQESCYGRYN